jgi:membrane protease YdiL (CAAX protease family)
MAASAFCMWAVFCVVAHRFCVANNTTLRDGFGLSITKRDWFVGIPVGLASQLVLVNVVTWPFAQLFPDAFSFDEVSRRATELTDQAQGLWIVVLVLVVVVGAPIAEEILYRGVLQNGATALLGAFPGLVTTAAIFALVHFSPVEIPGLFAFALVLGLLRKKSGRLGLPIATHMAFNVAGLLLVALV